MKYYKVTLENGDELFLESKKGLTDKQVIEAMVEEATLSPAETDDVDDVEQITEEEYEEGVL
jgi:hypothetical protein